MLWLENILAKFFAKKLVFFVQTTANFCPICIITLFFWKKRQMFCKQLAQIAENWDHNIDPWNKFFFPENLDKMHLLLSARATRFNPVLIFGQFVLKFNF
jgi:hypothetical protein